MHSAPDAGSRLSAVKFPTRFIRVVTLVMTLTLVTSLATACGEGESTFEDDAFAISVSTDIGVNDAPGRLLVGVLRPDGTHLGSPEQALELEVMPAGDPASSQRLPGRFMWILDGVSGLYRGDFIFDRPGRWVLTVHPATGEPLRPVAFEVLRETLTPGIGELAISAPTPTVHDAPLTEITTDPHPEPRFYETSLDEALQSNRKTVLVFSTPAFCQTAACGPVLEDAKTVATDHPDVTFIHVEVFTGFREPGFVPDSAHLAPAVSAEYWNLPTEPWVFVIDAAGIVTARFEGVMGADQLGAALG